MLDVYNAGLELPDDVTIIWPDDNYGYMKRLSSPREQKRSGRAGVYYHVSYLGKPHDYLWMSTISPALMYEELRKAYDATADRVWLLNVGDIKSCEFSMNLFLSMAYDINAFGYHNISTCQACWLADMFGQEYYEDFRDITTTFYHQSFPVSPNSWGGDISGPPISMARSEILIPISRSRTIVRQIPVWRNMTASEQKWIPFCNNCRKVRKPGSINSCIIR